MRIRIDPALGFWNTHFSQQVTGPGLGLFVTDIFVNSEHFSQLITHGVNRIQGGHGILKDHGNARATNELPIGSGQIQQ